MGCGCSSSSAVHEDICTSEDKKPNAAPSSGFSPQCTCSAFKAKGTCRHLPPALFLDGDGSSCKETGGFVQSSDLPGALHEPELQQAKKAAELELPNGAGLLELGSVIGRGASGATVLECKLAAGDGTKNCVAKVLPLGTKTTFDDMVEDFGREVKIFHQLGEHPCIVSFLGAWHMTDLAPDVIDNAVEAYAMCIEKCDGGALEELVKRRHASRTAFSGAELQRLLAPVSQALEHVHSRGIMHRDLKSANVFLQRQTPAETADASSILELPLESFRVKLGDFGVATDQPTSREQVQTLPFMAPEVMKAEGPYCNSADIWGFGCLVHELLELGLPYGDIDLPRLEEAIRSGDGPPLSDRKAAEERAQVIVALRDDCLTRDPAARPTATQLAKRLVEELS
eukprot:TRINITY_DN91400_c0_g1_i1.p1 TRINITY_DN91400_c0_g1~~TRINITY_DN91400_c0_g1_i1.p1  ORF type:complete len:398 (+),score=76.75 TRINITY_DN91400_c0_g1_i1:36-1229(+)